MSVDAGLEWGRGRRDELNHWNNPAKRWRKEALKAVVTVKTRRGQTGEIFER